MVESSLPGLGVGPPFTGAVGNMDLLEEGRVSAGAGTAQGTVCRTSGTLSTRTVVPTGKSMTLPSNWRTLVGRLEWP
jgi:hypothetical protein